MIRAVTTRAVAFPSAKPRVITGDLELRLATVLNSASSRPRIVTDLLSTVFSKIGGIPAEVAEVKRLNSSAREWLLQKAASYFWSETGWFETKCEACGVSLDFPAMLRDAPRKPAGPGFPVVEVQTSLGTRSFETPNGGHEEELLRAAGQDVVRDLLSLCGLSENAAQDAGDFSDTDISTIEDALDEASPEIADEVAITCTECGENSLARLDPLKFAFPRIQTLDREIHLIASAYHWSEDKILDLPSNRRRAYAALISTDKRAGVK